MSWYAKPRGGYTANSVEWKNNVSAIWGLLSTFGFTIECASGIIGNAMGESGLNPWRWESDTLNTSKGYGLFQFTPASEYFSKCSSDAYYAPNRSTSFPTEGASATDAICQINAFVTDKLGKWLPLCWREGEVYKAWVKSGTLWEDRRRILNKYVYTGANGISMEQFKRIDNVYDATFVFMACYEGPAVPNMSTRYANAQTAYQYLSEHPTPTKSKKMKLMYYCLRRRM